MKIVVVESPAKAKTINAYLGRGYEVLASFGHVRDLPAKDGSVDPGDDFRMIWEVDPKSQKRISSIADAVKGAEKLILATDPDREGEAISWHVMEALKQRRVLKSQAVERVVFNAITKQAVTEAMRHPRDIDQALVDAYLARRALDYLVGFTLSPVLWRKLPGAKSAGRVQSVALRLVCDRELEIEKFVTREYWSLIATLATPRAEEFQARLVGADGKKIQRLDIGTGADAQAFKQALETAKFSVKSVEARPAKRNPNPPFTTSTLQQEASRKLGFAPAHTMRIAQKLYEGITLDGETVGLITYMRTDGVQIADEAIASIRTLIGSSYGPRYLPGAPRRYQVKAKNAQEAHEAIRPTDPARRPQDVRRHLDVDQARLYELIWQRAVASQMESAELERTTVDIEARVAGRLLELRATGTVIKFDGFLTLYHEDTDDKQAPEAGDADDDARRLPRMAAGEPLTKRAIDASQHFTEPPPRYSEASLVKRMEELGIGRPSTYASILQVLQDRAYVRLDKKRLVPEDRGRIVVAFLESFFKRYVEYDFTADLEEQLDLVSNNELEWHDLLRKFWQGFTAAVDDIKDLRIAQVIDALDEMLAPHLFPARPDGTDPRLCPVCGTGRLSLKLGKFGAFIGCSNYPECRNTRPFSVPGAGDEAAEDTGTRVLGIDPESGLEVTLRSGRFGPYVQLGEAVDGEKPKRAGLLRGMQAADVDLETALRLLSLPREIGRHPEDGEPIVAANGRYGPYIQHGKTYANLEPGDDLFHIGLNRAITLIAEKLANPKKGRFGAAKDPGRSLGEHPDKGGPVVVKSGRYGPYVSHDGVNATLPKDKRPEEMTLAEALPLLAAREEYIASGGGKRPAKGKAAKDKAAKAPAKSAKAADKKAADEKPAKEAKGETKAKPVKKAAPKAAGADAEKPAKPARMAKAVTPARPETKAEGRPAVKTAAAPAKTTARAAPKAPAKAPAKKPAVAAKAPPKRAKGGK
jgi:DNA topoisomerase-1